MKKTSALIGSLDGCDDDKIVYIKYGPCTYLLVGLKRCPEISIDPVGSKEDEDIITD